MGAPVEQSATPSEPESVGAFALVVACLSFVPLLGVLVGVACLIYGLATRKRYGKVVAALGALGICSTFVVFGSLRHAIEKPGGTFAQLQSRLLAEQILPDLVKSIEYYRLQNGRYPASLDDLPKEASGQVELQNSGRTTSQGRIYYELNAQAGKYYLGAEGPDHQRFTPDDVLPKISSADAAKIGYTTKAQTP